MNLDDKILHDINFLLGTINGISFFAEQPRMFDAIDCAREILNKNYAKLVAEQDKKDS